MYINSQRLIDSEKFESIDRQKDRQRDTLIYLYTYIDIDTYIYIYMDVFTQRVLNVDAWIGQVNLTGGYYDAGDNVKFVWPMSFTVSLLGMAAVEYGTQVGAAAQLGNLRTAIRWGTDFLLRAYPSSTTFYTQAKPSLPLSTYLSIYIHVCLFFEAGGRWELGPPVLATAGRHGHTENVDQGNGQFSRHGAHRRRRRSARLGRHRLQKFRR